MFFLDDDALFQLVLEVDTELIEQGASPHKRPIACMIAIAERLGISFTFGDTFSSKINAIYHQLYRLTDLEMPPMHVGAFMFRDIFLPIRIPVVYGEFSINPVNLLFDITEFQKRWLFDNKVIGLTFFDQFIDLADFAYGLDDFEKTSSAERTKELWSLARRQLEAGAIVLGSFDVYAVIQNCCVAVELLLKGALFKEGMTDEQLKKHGHKIRDLASEVAKILPNVDKERLLYVADQLPNYVKSRYEVQDYSRRQLGNLVMNAQFIAGEIMRQYSDRDTRSAFAAVGIDLEWDVSQRMFPAKSAHKS
jgi:HEPN domain-containing protein